jgi:hypothetical protein
MQALLSCGCRDGVHGDVTLLQVDVHRPWLGGPAVIASISVVVILVSVVDAIGWSGRHERLLLRSLRNSAGVEHRRSSGRPHGVQVDLIQNKVIVNFNKVQQRRGASDDGPEMLEMLVEATKDVEDEDSFIDR